MILGSTSQIIPVIIRGSDGTGLAGLAAADVTASYMVQNNAQPVPIALADVAVAAAYSPGGWAETNVAGEYLLHAPNAAWTVEGITQFSFAATGAITSKPSAKVEKDVVRIGDSRRYTNDITADTELVTVTES